MKLILSCSGGVAGLRIRDALDTSELAVDLARRAEVTLRPEKLRQAYSSENPHRADALEYELTLLPEPRREEAQHYHFSETNTAPEVLDLLGELMREITRRRASSLRNN